MTIRRILRVIGSRYGIAGLLVLVVVGALVIAGNDPGGGPGNANDGSESSIEPGAPDDGYVPPPSASEQPGESEGPDDSVPEEAITVALSFAQEWILVDRSAEEWRSGLASYATERLAEQLAATEPVAVPARELRGDPVSRNGSVEIDTDAGLLILRVTTHDGSWYVDGVDFHKP
ncbi:hypothetical protein [Stackebrandtia soli]|uniref:hypothetical protein n=1 Tax=Stackebrandtia soli TaxID=1892856 RepID=UPI0039ECDE5F